MIEVDQRNNTALVVLKRPERRNAIDLPTMESLEHALKQLDREPRVGAIVLTGAPPGFCSGSDMKEMANAENIKTLVEGEIRKAAILRGFAKLSKPLLSAVEGFALGGGFILAISCDIVVSARDVKWQLPEVPNGWPLAWGVNTLIGRVGPATAKRLGWGHFFSGEEAARIHVVDYLSDPGGAVDLALQHAEQLASLPRTSVASVKRLLNEFVSEDAEFADAAACQAFISDCPPSAIKSFVSSTKKD